MAKNPDGLKTAINEVSQEIDLEKLTGVNLSKAKTIKGEIAQAIIDYMVARSKDGKVIGGRELSGRAGRYSDAYKNSLAFKAAGKSDQVNFTLSGDMLNTIDANDESSSKIKIEVLPEKAPQAFGLISGYEGHPTIKNGPKRPFFGITTKEFESEILPQFQEVIDEVAKENIDTNKSDLQSLIELANSLNFTLKE